MSTEPSDADGAPTAQDGLQARFLMLLGRKWLVTAFLLVAPLVLRCFNLMTESGLLTIWGLVATSYFGANVAQKFTSKTDTKKE